MGLADGLNKKKSMFDVTVRKFDNNQFILGKKAPYGGAMLLYFLSVGMKGNSLYNEAVDASK
jgi:filamentous hemagglutinin